MIFLPGPELPGDAVIWSGTNRKALHSSFDEISREHAVPHAEQHPALNDL